MYLSLLVSVVWSFPPELLSGDHVVSETCIRGYTHTLFILFYFILLLVNWCLVVYCYTVYCHAPTAIPVSWHTQWASCQVMLSCSWSHLSCGIKEVKHLLQTSDLWPLEQEVGGAGSIMTHRRLTKGNVASLVFIPEDKHNRSYCTFHEARLDEPSVGLLTAAKRVLFSRWQIKCKEAVMEPPRKQVHMLLFSRKRNGSVKSQKDNSF